mgnify:CR=1 FL=1
MRVSPVSASYSIVARDSLTGEMGVAVQSHYFSVGPIVPWAGKADAGVNDNGLLNYFASKNPDVEVGAEFETGDVYGFSVKKGANDELLEVINKAITSDEYDAAYKKWFGTAPE